MINGPEPPPISIGSRFFAGCPGAQRRCLRGVNHRDLNLAGPCWELKAYGFKLQAAGPSMAPCGSSLTLPTLSSTGKRDQLCGASSSPCRITPIRTYWPCNRAQWPPQRKGISPSAKSQAMAVGGLRPARSSGVERAPSDRGSGRKPTVWGSAGFQSATLHQCCFVIERWICPSCIGAGRRERSPDGIGVYLPGPVPRLRH
jgi:hypothetical protein